jgi:hypothetical protein
MTPWQEAGSSSAAKLVAVLYTDSCRSPIRVMTASMWLSGDPSRCNVEEIFVTGDHRIGGAQES